MLCYDPDDDDLITACNFNNTNIDELDPETIFRVGSKWKQHKLHKISTMSHLQQINST